VIAKPKEIKLTVAESVEEEPRLRHNNDLFGVASSYVTPVCTSPVLGVFSDLAATFNRRPPAAINGRHLKLQLHLFPNSTENQP